ncbi:MAG: hypothetical protein R8M37_00050 [Alphaproteobacteria bacterium]|nr:hypothetical protein [Alphaproteobacteria bacterium]
MKFIRVLMFSLFMAPVASFGATSDFMMAAQLLAAAKNADIQQVQALVNNGANVNFVDSTGLSIVCTALMNNDVRAAQILQMYGADASKCDRQIKQYNNRNKPRGGGGLFSGLSSAQSIALTAAGAAVVVGGLLLLTDVFDPGNDNDSSSSGGDRPSGGGSGGGSGGNATAAFTLPYGPAMPTAKDESQYYVENLDLYSPSDAELIYAKNFDLMTNLDGQNYLLMMHGYSPLARGYMGMRTLRSMSTREPFKLDDVNWRGEPVLGGRPVNVALVTANGVNANNYAYGVDAVSSLGDTLLPWTSVNGTAVNPGDDTTVSSKYYNNKVVLGTGEGTLANAVTVEDSAWLANFDLAGWGTVVNNTSATNDDNLLAKIVGGRDAGYPDADYIGFMPNGQMTIFRTGGGIGMVDATTESTGTYELTDSKLTQIVLFGETMTVVQTGNTFVATNSADPSKKYNGYIGANGYLYIDSGADGKINQAYSMTDGDLELVKELGTLDYLNYKAMAKAAQLWVNGDLSGGRSRVDVIANSSVISPLRAVTVETIDDILSLPADMRQTGLAALVNGYYDLGADTDFQGTYATSLFGQLGASFQPIMVFSTGGFETDSLATGKTLFATFENVVPLIYENAEGYFMSAVAVELGGSGTAGTTSVSGYSPTGKIQLAKWTNDNGTPDDDSDDTYYKARACGIAGTGRGSVDPWCFAGAGQSDEHAVSSVAGAVGAVKSAFDYLNNKQVFALLALTADGPLLGTTVTGTAFTEDTLTAYLKNMYDLPGEFQDGVDNGADYLDTFAQVFGYGLINLERATKPGTSVYFYDGNNIVSANGNAYWRVASNTMFRPSSVLSLRGATIRAPFYDVLESVDGKMSLPRVWENEFALGTSGERGLYMGDVLGDFKTRRDNVQRSQIGNIGLSMAFSERAYNDNMNGLDNLSLDYKSGNWTFGASYQHYLTDGVSRFDGLANPILGLASNAIVSDVAYENGNWTFGARAFSGAITDEGLLENDPTISAQYMPATLGLIQGAQSDVTWSNDKFAFTTSIGFAHESDTILGAQTGGLLNLGAGNTTYVDAVAKYRVSDLVDFTARATFARTMSDASGQFILGMTDVDSNAFAIGANIGNFEFAVSQPLAITDGALRYAYADYDVVEMADNRYELNVVNTHIEDLYLEPEQRELRFSGAYRHKFGEFTDGAFGFIYRVNPNHTDDFGNESIFMLKMSHRLGI